MANADEVTITVRLQRAREAAADAKKVKDAIDDVGGAVEKTDKKSRLASAASGGFGLVAKSIGLITRVATVGAAGLSAFALVMGTQSVSAASDLNETMSKTSQVFGKAGNDVLAWSKDSASAFGASRNDALTAAANYGNLFRNLGFVEKASAKMSKQLVATASDLASFNNATPQEMLDALSSALAGEYDPLQRYGFAISAAAVKQQALSMGLIHGKQQMSAAQQAAATYALVLKQTGKAQGDFQRTSGGLANQQRILAANWENLKSKIGQALLPATLKITEAINNQLMPALSDLVDKYGPKVATWLQDVTDKYGPKLIQWLRDFKLQMPSGETGANFGKIGDSLTSMFHSLGDMKGDVLTGVTNTVSVFSAVMGVAADHTDLLAKAIPALVVGFVAYKSAQAAANIAALLDIPMKAIDLVLTWQLVRATRALAVAKDGDAVASAVQAGAAGKAGLAAKAAAAMQWLWNAAMSANPIGLIIIAVIAVVAAVVVAYKKVGWFRDAVNAVGRAGAAAFGWIWDKIKSVVGWVKKHWPLLLGILTGPIGGAVIWITRHIDEIVAAFKSVTNSIIGIWNSLDFGIHIKAPSWLGGWGLDIDDIFPDIPMLATGGTTTSAGTVMVGERGPELLDLPVGAKVTPLDHPDAQLRAVGGDGGPVILQVHLDGKVLTETVLEGVQAKLARR